MTVSEVSNDSNTWSFRPTVTIGGAAYQTITASTGQTYVIQTGVQPSLSVLFYMVVVGAISLFAVVAFLWSRKRGSGNILFARLRKPSA